MMAAPTSSSRGVATMRRHLSIVTVSTFLLVAALSLYFGYASYGTSFGSQLVSTGDGDPEQVAAATNTKVTGVPSPSQNSHSADDADVNEQLPFVLQPNNHIFRKPKSIRLRWNITKEERAPDGVKKNVYLINGEFPGPTVEARSGDEIVVDVHNSITDEDEGISIHWHGLFMNGFNSMDGVVGLTQCSIGPAETFTYNFTIDDSQSGTFWYHAHSGVQRADGLFGALVVHPPATADQQVSDLEKFDYSADQLLLVGDWYHRQAETALDWFLSPHHLGNEPAPDSMLINGAGSYNCSHAVKSLPIDCHHVNKPTLRLASSNRIRLRVVNTGSSTGITLAMPNDSMKLIAVDGGNYVSNSTAASSVIGVLYPGERIDLIVERGKPASPSLDLTSGSHLTITLDQENMRLKNYALTRTQSFPLQWDDGSHSSKRVQASDSAGVSQLRLDEVTGLDRGDMLNRPAGDIQTTVLYTMMQLRAAYGNLPVGIVNHTSWLIADAKAKPLLAMDATDWGNATKQPTSRQRLKIPQFNASENKWIDIVLNNSDDIGHPFHLHGHDFYVLLVGKSSHLGGYNPFASTANSQRQLFNTATPLRKDTIYIPSGGFAVMRFPLINEGLWFLHCHVLWHQAAGMGIVLQIGNTTAESQKQASRLCTK